MPPTGLPHVLAQGRGGCRGRPQQPHLHDEGLQLVAPTGVLVDLAGETILQVGCPSSSSIRTA